jgi:hypothetical protein
MAIHYVKPLHEEGGTWYLVIGIWLCLQELSVLNWQDAGKL